MNINAFYALLIKALARVVIFLGAAIVLVVTIQVFSRFILQSPSSVTEELARFLLIWIGLFGGAYGYHSNAHLGLDILTNKLTDAKQKIANIIANIAILIFAVVVMIIGGVSLVSLTLAPAQISAALGIKIAYIYSAVPISGGLIVIISMMKISQLFTHVTSQRKDV